MCVWFVFALTHSIYRKLLYEKCGVERLGEGAMDYLRTHILTYMRAQAKHIAASMLYKFEKLKDVSGEYKTMPVPSRVPGQEKRVPSIKDGKKMVIPSKIINLEVHGPRLTMFMALLEKVIIKVATNGRWITENAGPRMRVTLTVKDMMVANALDKRLTDSLDDGLAMDAPRPGNKKYNWTKIREKMVEDALVQYTKEINRLSDSVLEQGEENEDDAGGKGEDNGDGDEEEEEDDADANGEDNGDGDEEEEDDADASGEDNGDGDEEDE